MADKIHERYNFRRNDKPLLVIGIEASRKTNGKEHYFNPKSEEFSELVREGTIKGAIVLAWEQPQPLK